MSSIRHINRSLGMYDIHMAQCVFEMFALPWIGTWSPWLLAGITIERCLAVYLPHRVRNMLTTTSAIIYVLVSMTGALVVHIRKAFVLQIERGFACRFTDDKTSKIVTQLVDFSFMFLVPFCILVVCNVMLCVKLIQSWRQRQQDLSSTQIFSNEIQAIVRAVVFSMIFLVMVLPRLVVLFIERIDDFGNTGSDYRTRDWSKYYYVSYLKAYADLISVLLLNISYASNIFLHLLSGVKPRRVVLELLCMCCNRRNINEM